VALRWNAVLEFLKTTKAYHGPKMPPYDDDDDDGGGNVSTQFATNV